MTTILVVDDDPHVLACLQRQLARVAQVLVATSAEEALAILAATEVQTVVTDYQMPGMSGLVLLAEVRQRWPSVGRMLHSGSCADEFAHALADGTVEVCLAKPGEPGALVQAIRRLAASSAGRPAPPGGDR